MQVREALACLTQALAAVSSEAPREARLFLASLLELELSCLNLHLTDDFPPGLAGRLKEVVALRLQGQPLQYIIGSEEFMSLTFTVNPAVLIPRADTEVVVERALELLRQWHGPLVADIGTGSGAIGVSLSYYCPEASIQAVDISPDALAVAQQNARQNQVAGRIQFLLGDLCQPLAGQFDLIVSNPPYVTDQEMGELAVEVQKEPDLALAAGPEGLDLYQRLIPQAYERLKPGGWLLVEIGSGQSQAVMELCLQAGFGQVVAGKDLRGRNRFVEGMKQA